MILVRHLSDRLSNSAAVLTACHGSKEERFEDMIRSPPRSGEQMNLTGSAEDGMRPSAA
jgi:hypothetical protein